MKLCFLKKEFSGNRVKEPFHILRIRVMSAVLISKGLVELKGRKGYRGSRTNRVANLSL